jgi:hypothetical protein
VHRSIEELQSGERTVLILVGLVTAALMIVALVEGGPWSCCPRGTAVAGIDPSVIAWVVAGLGGTSSLLLARNRNLYPVLMLVLAGLLVAFLSVYMAGLSGAAVVTCLGRVAYRASKRALTYAHPLKSSEELDDEQSNVRRRELDRQSVEESWVMHPAPPVLQTGPLKFGE